VASGESSVQFDSDGHVLRGVLHRPASEPKAGLVFVHPFAEEKKCSHRVMVEMARAAAAMGCAALRFDLRGCGDSDGEFPEVTLDDWRGDVRRAFAYARDELGCEAYALLGLRLGATLAVEVAEEELELACLALWEPVVDGTRYITHTMRRSMMRRKLTTHEGGGEATEAPDESDTGEVDFDGYLVMPEVREALSEIDLLSKAKAYPGPALILNLTPRQKAAAPMEELASTYVSGEVRIVRQEPIWSTVGLVDPAPTITATTEWLSQALRIDAPGPIAEAGR